MFFSRLFLKRHIRARISSLLMEFIDFYPIPSESRHQLLKYHLDQSIKRLELKSYFLHLFPRAQYSFISAYRGQSIMNRYRVVWSCFHFFHLKDFTITFLAFSANINSALIILSQRIHFLFRIEFIFIFLTLIP
jgi:hypothetical protein